MKIYFCSWCGPTIKLIFVIKIANKCPQFCGSVYKNRSILLFCFSLGSQQLLVLSRAPGSQLPLFFFILKVYQRHIPKYFQEYFTKNIFWRKYKDFSADIDHRNDTAKLYLAQQQRRVAYSLPAPAKLVLFSCEQVLVAWLSQKGLKFDFF